METPATTNENVAPNRQQFVATGPVAARSVAQLFFGLRTGAVWLSGISSHFCQVDQRLIIVSEFLGNVSCDHVSDAESC